MFIVIEGPSGVGKTTVAGLLGVRLAECAPTTVFATAEAVEASVRCGNDMRTSDLRGRALALALAALRTEHLESAIIPALDEGKVVLSDRYVQSSLVLQCADDSNLRRSGRTTSTAFPPSRFYLEDAAEVIDERRLEPGRSGPAADPSAQEELQLYRNAGRFLGQPPHDWIQHYIDCRHRSPSEVVTAILGLLPQSSSRLEGSGLSGARFDEVFDRGDSVH
jgi:dTMP kinase